MSVSIQEATWTSSSTIPHTAHRTPHFFNTSRPIRVLIAAEGSGGHVIPAIETAKALAAKGARVRVLCARRPQTAGLFEQLTRDAGPLVEIDPVDLPTASWMPRWLGAPAQRTAWWITRGRQALEVRRRALRIFAEAPPHVVAGFGGGFCVPIVLVARQHHTPVLIHEQNVTLGKANRWLLRRIDQLAVSFDATSQRVTGADCVVTGLPVRPAIGGGDRHQAAQGAGLDPNAPTVLIVGGSQGAGPINRLMAELLAQLTDEERRGWQCIHATGNADVDVMRRAYAGAGVRALVCSHLTDMAGAYAMADLVISRSGASMVAELSRCGKPALLIPYPHANAHQVDNARIVESSGGGVCFQEASITPERLLASVRELLRDAPRRAAMGQRIRGLMDDRAAQRLAGAVLALAVWRARHES